MRFPIVTLCGSLRAGKDVWEKVANDLSLQGIIVITLHVWEWERLHKGDMLAEKEILDQMHRQRIDMAHGVYIIDIVNGEKYIGESTRGELEYAKSKNKIVLYHSLLRNEGLTIEDLEPSINDLREGRESPYLPLTINSAGLRRTQNE